MAENETGVRKTRKKKKSENNIVTVLLAEDHTIVREGIRVLLEAQGDIEIVGEATNGKEAVAMTKELDPDLVIMDIAMPLLNGLEATSQIKRAKPNTKVLVLTMYTNEEYVLQMLKAGVNGYLVKKSAVADLIAAIEAVRKGEAFFSPSISNVVLKDYLRRIDEEKEGLDLLTSREKEVLQLVAEGHTNRMVAELLGVSVKTINIHRTNIMSKLDIHNAAGLVRYAIQKGLIRLE